MRRLVALACALAMTPSLTGCGSSGGDAPQTFTVLAAASLTGTYTELAAAFEHEHPGVKVKLVFDSSATLAQMAIEQAPGNVIATADRATMDRALADGGTNGDPVQFATNVLELAVPADNPAGIDTVEDLSRKGVDYLTCVRTAPCGAAAAKVLARLGITAAPASEEIDVKAVLNKVEQDEADAGLVYRSDVRASGGSVTGIGIPGAGEEPNTYWLAITADSPDDGLSQEWIDLVLSSGGQRVLRAAGFGPPPK